MHRLGRSRISSVRRRLSDAPVASFTGGLHQQGFEAARPRLIRAPSSAAPIRIRIDPAKSDHAHALDPICSATNVAKAASRIAVLDEPIGWVGRAPVTSRASGALCAPFSDPLAVLERLVLSPAAIWVRQPLHRQHAIAVGQAAILRLGDRRPRQPRCPARASVSAASSLTMPSSTRRIEDARRGCRGHAAGWRAAGGRH